MPHKSTNIRSEADARRLLTSCADGQFALTLQEVLTQYRVDGWLMINEAAALAGLSVRCFQRKLNAHGVAYARVTEATKREIAIQRLRCANQALCQIARELGYSDRLNFIRVFKRWPGHTPEQFRINLTQSIDTRLINSGSAK